MQIELPWYVVYTKSRQEQLAQEHLARQKYQTYLPLIKAFKNRRYNAKTMDTIYEPMFPRYVFFQTSDVAQSITPVRSTVGIANFVRFGSEIAKIKYEILQKIQWVEEKQHKGSFEEIGDFKPGHKVEITQGPFAGLEGLISQVSEKRIMVLMQLLGRDTTIIFNSTQLMAAV